MPRAVPLDRIRREGRRLGYQGEALADFVETVRRIDDAYVEHTVRREAAMAKDSAAKMRRQR